MTDPKLLLQNCRNGIRRHSLRGFALVILLLAASCRAPESSTPRTSAEQPSTAVGRVLQKAHGAADQFNRSNQSLQRQFNAVEQG